MESRDVVIFQGSLYQFGFRSVCVCLLGYMSLSCNMDIGFIYQPMSCNSAFTLPSVPVLLRLLSVRVAGGRCTAAQFPPRIKTTMWPFNTRTFLFRLVFSLVYFSVIIQSLHELSQASGGVTIEVAIQYIIQCRYEHFTKELVFEASLALKGRRAVAFQFGDN